MSLELGLETYARCIWTFDFAKFAHSGPRSRFDLKVSRNRSLSASRTLI